MRGSPALPFHYELVKHENSFFTKIKTSINFSVASGSFFRGSVLSDPARLEWTVNLSKLFTYCFEFPYASRSPPPPGLWSFV